MGEIDERPVEYLATDVPGLDPVLGGGLPRYSFNIIAGTPGAGKTTLAQHILYNRATPERSALYVTVLGEPPLKMLRYQAQFTFFDGAKVGSAVHYLNLNDEVLGAEPGRMVDRILEEVERLRPEYVVVDSFRSFARIVLDREDGTTEELQGFVYRLALTLAAMEATTFLIGEYPVSKEAMANSIFTVADGILWLYQPIDNNSTTRKLQVMKMRGGSPLPGLHSLRITGDGIRVYPRGYRKDSVGSISRFSRRLSTGVPGLDEMLGGGIPEGETALLAGPPGSGKSTLALQYAAAGLEAGEAVVLAVFEERPEGYRAKARTLGIDLDRHTREGRAEIVYLRTLDLSVDETLFELHEAVKRLDAKRVILDSISGLEVALAPTYEADFRETLYNLSAFLTDHGITVLMTVETGESFDRLQFTRHTISLIADTFILQRYVELEGRLEPAVAVIKMRHSSHDRAVRRVEISADGLHVGETLEEYRQVITGLPLPADEPKS
ncbi:MAG: AAA family ATPase [Gemmatimonadetes bacterium]|nr:AAA family ATPase [Gemmatimonadota bacterium]NIQ59324.1 AAA family ATPase [Gemmatimonadota bacterium]NIU79512.1 AAA family ATPase [Gammaproteobacteria bacterium]NIX48146.1 AAA family ATPase [Gemmatimonadota bacterium]NIY12538.1 AAA family ATPase [Gemmatimonadota bacterium]